MDLDSDVCVCCRVPLGGAEVNVGTRLSSPLQCHLFHGCSLGHYLCRSSQNEAALSLDT